MKREILSILPAEDICQMQCSEEKQAGVFLGSQTHLQPQPSSISQKTGSHPVKLSFRGNQCLLWTEQGAQRRGGQGRMRDQASRHSPDAHGLQVLETCLHIPRNDPMEQSDYIIFSSHQCRAMVPDGKGQNPVFNSVLTLTLTNCLKFLIKVLSPKCSYSFLTKIKGDLVGSMSDGRFEPPTPALAGQLPPGHLRGRCPES